MRKLLALSVLVTIVCTLAAREKVIETPYWGKSSKDDLRIKWISLSDTATTISFRIYRWGSQSWRLSSKAHLEADGKNYPLRYVKKYNGKTGMELPFALDSVNYFTSGQPDSLIVVFNPLPKKTKAFDFRETGERNGWHIFDIRTVGEPYPSAMTASEEIKGDEKLPLFVPKAGKAILNVRYHGSKKKYNIFCGNWNVEGNFITKENTKWTQDTIGNGVYRAELFCMSPTYVELTIPYYDGHASVILEPQQELNIDLDLPTLVNKGIESDKRYPQHKYGNGYVISGNLAKFDMAIHTDKVNTMVLVDSLIADTTLSFNGYVAKIWNKYQTRLAQTDSDSTKDDEQKQFLRLRNELAYVNDRMDYAHHIRTAYVFKYYHNPRASRDSICDIKKREAEKHFSMVDPHAKELTLFQDMRSAYITDNTSILKYMEANGITTGDFYHWLKDKKRAEMIAEKLNALHPLADIRTLDSISPVYAPLLRQLNDTALAYQKRTNSMMKTKVCETDAEKDVLTKIVEKYKGSVVFVDCWATWCGPCKMGIKAMKPVEEELADKNVKFVFLTNASSPIMTWTEMIQTMSGYHYRLTDNQWSNLPGISGGIPRYFIFDRDGKQLMDETGWNDERVEKFKNVILQALK